MSVRRELAELANEWEERAAVDLSDPRARPMRAVAGATRKNCAWELMRILRAMEKENPSEDGLIPPQDADRESA